MDIHSFTFYQRLLLYCVENYFKWHFISYDDSYIIFLIKESISSQSMEKIHAFSEKKEQFYLSLFFPYLRIEYQSKDF